MDAAGLQKVGGPIIPAQSNLQVEVVPVQVTRPEWLHSTDALLPAHIAYLSRWNDNAVLTPMRNVLICRQTKTSKSETGIVYAMNPWLEKAGNVVRHTQTDPAARNGDDVRR